MLQMNHIENAVSTFVSGFSCSQAILSSFGVDLGIDREIALKIASSFGGGMARLGRTCGAVTGAFMVLGLKYGRIEAKDTAAKERNYQVVNDFVKKFTDRNDSIICAELLGYNLRNPEERKIVKEKNLLSTHCVKFVRDAAEILEEML